MFAIEGTDELKGPRMDGYSLYENDNSCVGWIYLKPKHLTKLYEATGHFLDNECISDELYALPVRDTNNETGKYLITDSNLFLLARLERPEAGRCFVLNDLANDFWDRFRLDDVNLFMLWLDSINGVATGFRTSFTKTPEVHGPRLVTQ